jgi:protein-S-isoprenylcysteine O-methyltransferase Ste14
MFPRCLWQAYLVLAYALVPLVFRIRFGFWPYVFRRDVYTAVDMAYAGVLASYTWVVFFRSTGAPVTTTGGSLTFAAGVALQLWAVCALGPNWRIGQDPDDRSVRYVATGPFRFLRDPIYISLILVAIGHGLLQGMQGWSFYLLVATLAHYVVQGQSEARIWHRRLCESGDAENSSTRKNI